MKGHTHHYVPKRSGSYSYRDETGHKVTEPLHIQVCDCGKKLGEVNKPITDTDVHAYRRDKNCDDRCHPSWRGTGPHCMVCGKLRKDPIHT